MPGCALTQGFPIDCKDNSGGIDVVYLAEYDAVETFTESAGVITGITLAADKQFYRYSQVKQTADATEALATSEENGTVAVTQTVNLVLNKLQTATRNELDKVVRNRLLAVVTDKNGKSWLYGYKGALTANANAGTGKMLADRNGYTVVLTGMETAFAPEVQASVVATLTTPGS